MARPSKSRQVIYDSGEVKRPLDPAARGKQNSFTFPQDARDAAWLKESLEKPWTRQPNANFVASVVPNCFAAYVRILHPAYTAEPRRTGVVQAVTWQEVADSFGQKAHAQMQWHAITKLRASSDEAPGLISPDVGSLPAKQANALIEILGRHTTSVDNILLAIWEGWGAFDLHQQGQKIPRFELPDRGYYLLQAPIHLAAESLSSFHRQSANLWWPQDRAWCVATEIDLMWTYVGGTTACITEIMADARLEAWQATLDDRIDIDADQLNIHAP